MMMDDRFPQDTLFLFFESDFRFWECHDIPSMQWLPHLLGEKTETTADSASSSSAPAERAPTSGKRAVSRSWRGVEPFERPRDVGGDDIHPDLKDIMHTATQAFRSGYGDVIWWSWNGGHPGYKGRRAFHPAFGSQFVSFTGRAARELHAKMHESVPEHFDIWLRRTLIKDVALNARSCYVRLEAPSKYSGQIVINLCRTLSNGTYSVASRTIQPPQQDQLLCRQCHSRQLVGDNRQPTHRSQHVLRGICNHQTFP